jgi:putative SOS response-associated peptidase YedK
MCGRYTLSTPAEVIAELFELDEVPALEPRYNIAPTQEAPVVRLDPRGPTPRRRLHLLRWGLVPWWADDPTIGNRMINARAESAAEKRAFADHLRRHRCLVVADGFYEWRKEEGGKQPYWIHRPDGRPFAFAGLWSRWRPRDEPAGGEKLDTFTILTVDAAPAVRPLHDRMPAILDPADWSAWLDPARDDPAAAQALLARADGGLTLRRVGRRVNKPDHDAPDCIEALAAEA